MVDFPCSKCGKVLRTYPCHLKNPDRKMFCSPDCRRQWLKENRTGSQNPNFGKKWGAEQRAAAGTRMQERMQDPEARFEAGKANRGKKLSPERCDRMRQGKLRSTKKARAHNATSRQKIGQKSAQKWNTEYRQQHRATMEARGRWVPEAQKSDLSVYYKAANWPQRMYEFTSPTELELLRVLGVYNTKTNRGGVVRDHRFSRRSGFRLGVFPELLRHPANCQLLTHPANISKGQRGNQDRDDQSLDELFAAIKSREWAWPEQVHCLDLIAQYEQGARWERNR